MTMIGLVVLLPDIGFEITHFRLELGIIFFNEKKGPTQLYVAPEHKQCRQ